MFNPAAVSECFKELPLRGCLLSRNMNDVPYEMKDGIPYTLSLGFNRRDKLTDIGLHYDREGGISFDQCIEIHGRTLDWLTRDFGPLRAQMRSVERGTEIRKTPDGTSFPVWFGKDRSFIAGPMRTVANIVPTPVEKQPITTWDKDRYVSLLTHFIIVGGKPICGVVAEFQEPVTVERDRY